MGDETETAEVAEIEQEVGDLLDAAKANLDRAETHGTLGRGVEDLYRALDAVARKLAEELAYKADLSETEDRFAALEAEAPGAAPGLPDAVRETFLALVQAWWTWAPALVATGDSGLLRFSEEFGRQVEAHARAMLPVAMGIAETDVDGYLAASPPFVPGRPIEAAARPDGAQAPAAAG